MQYGIGYGRIVSLEWPFVDLIFDLAYGNAFYGKWEAWPISNSNLWIEPEIFVLESNSSHQKLGFSNQRMQISEQSANRQRQWELFRHQRLLIAPNILSPPSKLHPCENSSSIHFHTRTVGGLIHIQGRHWKSVWKTDEMRITHEDEEFREEVMKEEETLLRQRFLVIDVMMWCETAFLIPF